MQPAEKASVAVDEESEAVTVRADAAADRAGLVAGVCTDTVLVIDQVKLADPEKPSLSVAVNVTE